MSVVSDYAATTESVVLALLALFLLTSPFATWWMQLTPPWYFPYLLWLALVAASALLARRLARYDV